MTVCNVFILSLMPNVSPVILKTAMKLCAKDKTLPRFHVSYSISIGWAWRQK